ncbi:MAG: ABC transporter permease [Clostridia bacterium]|nr:ABC transporter permease [Clostridia bacterium]
MDMKKSRKLLAVLAACYWALVLLIYLVAGEQFHYTAVKSEALSPSSVIGEIVDGVAVTQRLTLPAETTQGLELMVGTYGRTNQGTMHLTLADLDGKTIAYKELDISSFADGTYVPVVFDEPVQLQVETQFLLTITTEGCDHGNAVTLYCGNSVNAGRFDIAQSIEAEELYIIGNQTGMGKLCVKINSIRTLSFYKTYWVVVAVLFVMAAAICVVWWRRALQGKTNPLVSVCTLYSRYDFLLRQLVSREFNKKYKRSVLGVTWSFFNPLLTMLVQYIVFSKLFHSNVPNYPVYLLTGVVFMQFYTTAVSTGMNAITGNASLIKKVYMPKYIYPLSRIISSLINFLISLIPLLLVILITKTPIRPSMLLLVFDILCMLGFVAGMVMLMTTAMTFFQDTQFIWSVLSVMWTYLTPIFYPETIIPTKLLPIYHMNPMYQYIKFARTCIIDGISPEPISYLWCILTSAVVLLLGVLVFKKCQSKFVLHL